MTAVSASLFPVKGARRAAGKAVFSPRERRALSGRRFPQEGLAARLAAKTALASLFGQIGLETGRWDRIEIANDASGRPFFKFLDARTARLVRLNTARIWVSLTHTRDWGMAAVAARLP